MEKVYVVFETPQSITDDEVKEFNALGYRFCELVTYNEVLKKIKPLDVCRGILDCTIGFKIYESMLKRKEGNEYKNSKGETYLRTVKGNFIVKGVLISQLMCAKFNKGLQEEQNKSLDEYQRKIKTLLMLIPKISNKLKFEEGFKSQEGIDVSDVIGGGRVYKLVKKLPEFPSPNVEYITPDDINILKDLLKVGEHIE